MSTPSSKPWEHAKSSGTGDDPFACRFVESLSYDRRLFKHDIAGSIAHARMLAHVKLISPKELGAIETGLKNIQTEIEKDRDAWKGWKTELEDLHMCIEVALIEKIGDPGRKLHTGRSRNDQIALDLQLWLAEAQTDLDAAFHRLQQALIDLAGTDGRIIMPAYTHLQRAQPVVAGAELLAWVTALHRARTRLQQLLEIGLANPLGSGAVAGSSLPLDRRHHVNGLGVGEPTVSSIDATSHRDPAIDFVYALSMTAMTLSRFAEQWILYASTEFGFIKLDDRYTTGSSMMPQKRNPDMLELIRGRCGGIYGHLMALLTICKGLPLAYNRDLQEDKRHLFAAFDTVLDCLEMAARIVATTRFDESRIAASLEAGFLDATSLAEYLLGKGIPFRTAHQIVGALVQSCEHRGLDRLSDLTLDDLNTACKAAGQGENRCDRTAYDWLGPRNVVARYQTAGNAGMSGVEQQLEHWKGILGKCQVPSAKGKGRGVRALKSPKSKRDADSQGNSPGQEQGGFERR